MIARSSRNPILSSPAPAPRKRREGFGRNVRRRQAAHWTRSGRNPTSDILYGRRHSVPRRISAAPMSKHINNLPLLAASGSWAASRGLQLRQSRKAAGNFDGPAELPRVYVKSAVADTPAPGKVWRLKEGDSIQQALQRAACGDVIELQPAARFDGSFELPSKSCDDSH